MIIEGGYKKTLNIGFVNSIVSKLSTFINLWLMNKILSSAEFGSYILALTIIELLIMFSSGGLDKLIIYKFEKIEDANRRQSFILNCIKLGLAISFFLVFLLEIVLTKAPDLHNNYWLSRLAFIIPIQVILRIYSSWYFAKQNTQDAIIMSQILPNLLNTIFLIVNYLFFSEYFFIILGVYLAYFLSLVPWLIKDKIFLFEDSIILGFDDLKYSAKLMLVKLVYVFAKKGDIFILGILTSETVVAEYTVASKLAILILTFHLILEPVFAARVGYLNKLKKKNKLFQEYDDIRNFSSLFALIAIIFFVLYGGDLLGFMGNYSNSYSLLLILLCTYFTITIFGCNGLYLSLSGKVEYTLKITAASSLVGFIINYFAISNFGVHGIAICSLGIMVIINILFTKTIFDIESFNSLPLQSTLLWILVVAILLLVSFSTISANTAFIILFVLCLMWSFHSLGNYERLFGFVNKGE